MTTNELKERIQKQVFTFLDPAESSLATELSDNINIEIDAFVEALQDNIMKVLTHDHV